MRLQARSKAKTIGGGGGGGGESKLVEQNNLPPVTQKIDRLGSLIIRCKENVKKAIDLVSKTITLHLHHTFWYISLIYCFFYADYHVKFPNFTFPGGRKQTATIFSHSFEI